MWVLLAIVLVLLLFLIWSERGSQDCLNKKCGNATEPVNAHDKPKLAIDKTIETLRKNHTLVGWRRALFIALILAFPLCYILRFRNPQGWFPSGYEFFVITSVIFVIAYFSSVWLNAVWFAPQDHQIEKSLLHLRSLAR
jgi:hypothetical protein